MSAITGIESASVSAKAIAVLPEAARVFATGHFAWDAPGGGSRVTNGRVGRCEQRRGALVLTIDDGSESRRVTVSPATPIVVLRKGTRAALTAPASVFIFAAPPSDGISAVVQAAVVGAGPVVVPL